MREGGLSQTACASWKSGCAEPAYAAPNSGQESKTEMSTNCRICT